MSKNGPSNKRKIALIVGILVVVLIFPLVSTPGLMNFAINGLIGAILALGLNIFFGYCGQINFGVAGFFAVGGYSVALLETYLHLPFAVTLFLGAVFSGIVAFVISIFLVRLRGHTLALGTFAFALAVYTGVAKAFSTYTGGEDGLNLAPVMLPHGVRAGDHFFYYLAALVIVACCWLSWTLRESRVGRAMVEIAENETAALSFGVNINRYVRLALVLNGITAGIAGGIFVKWTGWISPEYFGIMSNVIPVLALVVGGVGSIVGALVGGISMYILPLVLINFGEISVLTYGVILSVFLLFLPQGIVGEIRNFFYSRRLKSTIDQTEG